MYIVAREMKYHSIYGHLLKVNVAIEKYSELINTYLKMNSLINGIDAFL
jgi:hypothetical protein